MIGYDDAVKAVACALEEGIVEGGGKVLTQIMFNIANTEHSELENNC